MFTGDTIGVLKQWCLKKNKLVKNYGKVCSGWIKAIKVILGDRYLLTGDLHGNLNVFSLKRMVKVKTFKKILSGGVYNLVSVV